MIKSVNKFKRIIDKSYAKKFHTTAKAYVDKLDRNKFGVPAPIFLGISTGEHAQTEYPAFSADYEKIKAQFFNNSIEADELADLDLLIQSFESNAHAFRDFDILEKYLTGFSFTQTEKLEVFAFYLNKTLRSYLKFDIENNHELIKDAVTERVKSEGDFTEEVLEESYRETLKAIEQDIKNCHLLRNVISEEGEILPYENATSLASIFDDIDFNLNKEITYMILEESERRYNNSKTNNVEDLSEKAALEEEKRIKERQSLKTKAEAARELKQYIVNGKPVKVISKEEMKIIMDLLFTLDYLVDDIINIQKEITKFNKQAEEDKLLIKFENAKKIYLSESEYAILSEIENILTDKRAVKNLAFNSLKDNYELVKSYLLSLDTASSEEILDITELIALGLTDLSSALESYKLSDYRYVPIPHNACRPPRRYREIKESNNE